MPKPTPLVPSKGTSGDSAPHTLLAVSSSKTSPVFGRPTSSCVESGPLVEMEMLFPICPPGVLPKYPTTCDQLFAPARSKT